MTANLTPALVMLACGIPLFWFSVRYMPPFPWPRWRDLAPAGVFIGGALIIAGLAITLAVLA